jgi:hypothetical protein
LYDVNNNLFISQPGITAFRKTTGQYGRPQAFSAHNHF